MESGVAGWEALTSLFSAAECSDQQQREYGMLAASFCNEPKDFIRVL